MGIRLSCPNGHKLHLKAFLAGKRGVCPTCGATFLIPADADAAKEQAPPSSSIAGTPSVVIPVDQAASESMVPVPPTSVPPPVIAEPPPSASPVGKYFSSRRRSHRRTQMKVAIVLLIVALILVLVLAWVLWSGRG